jgi:hypothetical protein
MMPIMIIVVLVPRIVLIVLVSMFPTISMEIQMYAWHLNTLVGMPTFIAIASDIRRSGRRSGGYQADTKRGGKNAPHQFCRMGPHERFPFWSL